MLIRYNDSLGKRDPFRLLDDLLFGDDSVYTKQYSDYRIETDEKSLSLFLDVPGVKHSDLDVNVVGKEVQIEGIQRGVKFTRRYSIHRDYEPSSVEASLEDGVLTLSFEKSTGPPKKKVNIRVSK